MAAVGPGAVKLWGSGDWQRGWESKSVEEIWKLSEKPAVSHRAAHQSLDKFNKAPLSGRLRPNSF